MPAITVDDITTLRRLPQVEQTATQRRVRSVTTAPRGFEGEGFPVRRAFAGRRPARARPVHPHGPDGRGRVRAGRAEGHAVAPAPRLRDRHLHDRRDLRAPGLQRRRRRHHQRRHPVDDRRRRHPAHRDAAGAAGRERRPVPRPPALGEPAEGREVGGAALPGHPRRARSALLAIADGGALRAGHRRRGRRARRARATPTPRSPWCTPPSRPAPSSSCRGGPTSTRSSTCWPAPAPSAPSGSPVAHRPARRVRRRRRDHRRGRRRPGEPLAPSSTCCSSAAADPRAGRVRTGRS